MILHQPRPSVSWFSRLLSLAALVCLMALVGGLSVVTLQPLAADDEPKQPAPASVVEHPLGSLTASPAATPISPPATLTSQVIELSCIAIELEPAELAKALSGGEHPPLPSPAVELGIQTADEWNFDFVSCFFQLSQMFGWPGVTGSGKERGVFGVPVAQVFVNLIQFE